MKKLALATIVAAVVTPAAFANQALAEKKNCELASLSLTDMHSVNDRITTDVYKVLSVENSVASRVSFGGTAPRNVAREAARWLKLLGKQV